MQQVRIAQPGDPVYNLSLKDQNDHTFNPDGQAGKRVLLSHVTRSFSARLERSCPA